MDKVHVLIKKTIKAAHQIILTILLFAIIVIFVEAYLTENKYLNKTAKNLEKLFGINLIVKEENLVTTREEYKNLLYSKLEYENDEKTIQEGIYHIEVSLEKFNKTLREAARALGGINIPEERIKEALEARKMGNIEVARRLLQETSEHYQSQSQLLQETSEHYQSQSQQKRAIIAFLQGNIAKEDFRWREALGYYNKAIELAPEDIRYRNSAGSMEILLGNYARAKTLFDQALEKSHHISDPEHPDMLSSLISLSNLAGLYSEQGRYADAEPLFIEVLEKRRRILGVEHPGTLSSLNNLAVLYSEQGRYADAEMLYLEVLEKRRHILGAEHPDTLASRNSLAGLYSEQGRYADAEERYLEVLEKRRYILGPEHPDTLGSLNNLAVLYSEQGRYADAEPLFLEALEKARKNRGDENLLTKTIQKNYDDLKSYKK